MSGKISILSFFNGTQDDFQSICRTLNHFSDIGEIAIIRDMGADEGLLQPLKAMYPSVTVHPMDRRRRDDVHDILSSLVSVQCGRSGSDNVWIDVSNANQLEVFVSTLTCFLNNNHIYCNRVDLGEGDLDDIFPGYIHHIGKVKKDIIAILIENSGTQLSANEILAAMKESGRLIKGSVPSAKQVNVSLRDLMDRGIIVRSNGKREGSKDRYFYRITDKGIATYNMYLRDRNR